MKHYTTCGDLFRLPYRMRLFFLRPWWKFTSRNQPIVLDVDGRRMEMVYRRIDWAMRDSGLQGIVDNFFQDTPLPEKLRGEG